MPGIQDFGPAAFLVHLLSRCARNHAVTGSKAAETKAPSGEKGSRWHSSGPPVPSALWRQLRARAEQKAGGWSPEGGGRSWVSPERHLPDAAVGWGPLGRGAGSGCPARGTVMATPQCSAVVGEGRPLAPTPGPPDRHWASSKLSARSAGRAHPLATSSVAAPLPVLESRSAQLGRVWSPAGGLPPRPAGLLPIPATRTFRVLD